MKKQEVLLKKDELFQEKYNADYKKAMKFKPEIEALKSDILANYSTGEWSHITGRKQDDLTTILRGLYYDIEIGAISIMALWKKKPTTPTEATKLISDLNRLKSLLDEEFARNKK